MCLRETWRLYRVKKSLSSAGNDCGTVGGTEPVTSPSKSDNINKPCRKNYKEFFILEDRSL